MINSNHVRILTVCLFTITANSSVVAATLSGTITDSADWPLAGICVDAIDAGSGNLESVQSNSSGAYTLTLPAGNHWLRTRTECATSLPAYENRYWGNGGTTLNLWDSTPIGVAEGDALTGYAFSLSAGRRITGQVTGPDGSPLEGAKIEVFGGVCWGGKLGEVMTDNNGNYAANARAGEVFLAIFPDCTADPAVLPLQTEWWTAGGGEMACPLGMPVPESTSAVSDNIDFQLAYAARLKGRVAGAADDVPAGAIVQAFSGPNWQGFLQNAPIDPNTGDYVLCLSGGDAYVRVFFGNDLNQPPVQDPNLPSPTRYAGEWWNDALSLDEQDPILLVSGETTSDTDFTLRPANYVTGIVTDLDTGDPLIGIGVGAYANPCYGGWIGDAVTNDEGRYYLWLAEPAYLVTCDDCIDTGTPYDGIYTHRWLDGDLGSVDCDTASTADPGPPRDPLEVNLSIQQTSAAAAQKKKSRLELYLRSIIGTL